MIEPFVKRMDEFMQTPFQGEGNRKVTWWWCDALFMMPPALVKLGITLHEDRHLSLSDKLFKECYDFLYDKEAHLFFRDLRFVPGADPELKEANGEKVFWSRGNGWVVGGLVKLLQELPADYPERPFYEQLFKEMAVKTITLQQEDGLWRASLLDPESYPGGEASGSGFFCYALAWGINKGLLDKAKFLSHVTKAWEGLNSLIQPDGRVGWVQPVGSDPRRNFSADSWEVYGTGAFLLAGSEVIKLNISASAEK